MRPSGSMRPCGSIYGRYLVISVTNCRHICVIYVNCDYCKEMSVQVEENEHANVSTDQNLIFIEPKYAVKLH